MPNYSLNNAGPEPDRSLIDRDFHGMNETRPATASHSAGGEVPPGNIGHPLTNEVNPSSDTASRPLGAGVQENLER